MESDLSLFVSVTIYLAEKVVEQPTLDIETIVDSLKREVLKMF